MSSSAAAQMAPPGAAPGAPGSNTPMIIGGVVFLLIVLVAAYYYTKKAAPEVSEMPAAASAATTTAAAVVAPPPIAAPAPAPTPPSTFNTAAAYVGPSNGTDWPGNDLGNWSNADPNFCADKCNNTPGCIGFVVSTTGQGCYAKSKFENAVASATSNTYAKPDVVLPNAATKYQAAITGHYAGNEIGTFANIDPNFCATKCNATQGCVAFETDTASCTIKSQLTEPLDSSKTGFKVYKKPGVVAVAAPVPAPGAAPAPGSAPSYAVPGWRDASVPDRFYLKNISTGKFVFAGADGKVGEGPSASPITADKPADLYNAFGNSANFKRLAIGPGYLRHSSSFLFAQPYVPNNFDFAWEVFTNGSQFMLWNPYPGSGAGHWVAADPNTRLKIQPTWAQAAVYQIMGIGTPGVPVYTEPAATASPVANYQMTNNYDYPGTDLQNVPNSDPVNCAALCDANQKCVGFITATDSQNCWLKGSFGQGVPSTVRPSYFRMDTLSMSQTMVPGQFIISKNKQYKFTYQTDANIVLYRVSDGRALWAVSWLPGAQWNYPPGKLIMQTDGNLVAYDNANAAKWASNTWNKGTSPYRLTMQNDGNVVLYDANNTATWATNTAQYTCSIQ